MRRSGSLFDGFARRAVALVACAVAGAAGVVAIEGDARADECDEPPPPKAGLAEGETKLALGVEYAGTGDDHALRLDGEFEHMLRNHWGLAGSSALPVSGRWVASGMGGLRFHVLARSAIDPFVGLAGGFAWVKPSGFAADLVPLIGMRLGLALYSSGAYFVQAEAGYDFVRYDHAGVGFDLGGFVASGKVGFYF